MFSKSLILSTVLAVSFATLALAAPADGGPGNRLHKLDRKLDRMEHQGVIKQGSRLDKLEDRILSYCG